MGSGLPRDGALTHPKPAASQFELPIAEVICYNLGGRRQPIRKDQLVKEFEPPIRNSSGTGSNPWVMEVAHPPLRVDSRVRYEHEEGDRSTPSPVVMELIGCWIRIAVL